MKSKSKILKYAKRSDIMDISIKMGSKTFTFNLHEELLINAETIEDELINQPSYYGYLGMLKNKLQRKVDDTKIEVNKKYANLYLKFKDASDETNKAEAARSAKYKVESSPIYIGLEKKLNKYKENLGIIETCLDSFDQRSRMVQSINTNRRQEH